MAKKTTTPANVNNVMNTTAAALILASGKQYTAAPTAADIETAAAAVTAAAAIETAAKEAFVNAGSSLREARTATAAATLDAAAARYAAGVATAGDIVMLADDIAANHAAAAVVESFTDMCEVLDGDNCRKAWRAFVAESVTAGAAFRADEEKEECRTFFNLFVYSVWNIDQTNFKEVYPDDYAAMAAPPHEYRHDVIDPVLERMIHVSGEWRCPILFGGHSAHFSPSEDHIRLPQRDKFLSDEAFYGTALHEMAHSTGPELKREGGLIFGDPKYAEEEFIAELTSACVGSMLGVGKLLDQQHLAYVDNWRKAIRENGDFIPRVIDHVQRATNYILRRYETIAKSMNLPKMIAA